MKGELEVVSASSGDMPATDNSATKAFLALTLLGATALGGGWLIRLRQRRYQGPTDQEWE